LSPGLWRKRRMVGYQGGVSPAMPRRHSVNCGECGRAARQPRT
jgi:hypothetical protein